MQVQVEGLIFLNDKTPQIKNLVHGILLEACQTHCLLYHLIITFKQFLTGVRVCEKFRDVKASPGNLNIKNLRLFITLRLFY